MYVCICNAIRETDLVAIARKHRGTTEELYARLGFEPQCGECLNFADRLIAEARQPQPVLRRNHKPKFGLAAA